MRFNLIGGEATSESINVDAGHTLNWYPELVESGTGATKVAMFPTPGLTTFATMTGSAVRGALAFNGRLFAVATNFNEIASDGTVTPYSFLPVDANPVTMAANNVQQLLICAGGELWMFPLVAVVSASIVSTQGFANSHGPEYLQITFSSMPFSVGQVIYFSGLTTETWLNGQSFAIATIVGNTANSRGGSWTSVAPTFPYGPTSDTGTAGTAANVQITTGLVGPVSQIAFIDGYYVALIENSQTFQLSALEDALTWDPGNASAIELYADNVVAMFVHNDQIWFFGSKATIPYYNTGDLLNPFQPVPGAIIEQGCAAQFSVARLDNSICWLGQDELGHAMAWRADGYLPQRISTHYVENIWHGYTTISDAIAYSYQQNGHAFWVLYFPTANATWVYDAAAPPNMRWTERGWLHNGAINAHRSRCQAFAFGKTLVGDTQSGHLYWMDPTLQYDDVSGAANSPIQSLRRSPHIQNEKQWLRHQRLQIDLEAGRGSGGTNSAAQSFVNNDTSGASWSYAVNNSGALSTPASATSQPETMTAIFQDTAVPTNFYSVAIDTSGALHYIAVQQPQNFVTGVVAQSANGDYWLWQVTSGATAISSLPTVDPQIGLRWFDGLGHVPSNQYSLSVGGTGDYNTRAIRWQLGRSRDRVYEISTTDYAAKFIVDAYLEASP